MKHVRYLAAFLAAGAVWAMLPGGGVASGATTTTSAVTTSPAESPAADPKEVKAKAFGELLAGRFDSGMALLGQAGRLQPDQAVTRAEDLTAAYLDLRAGEEAKRQAEQAAAVRRVQLARLTEQYRSRLIEQKLDQKVFDLVNGVAEGLYAANKQLQGNGTSHEEQARKDAGEGLQKAQEQLALAEQAVAAEKGPWPDEFRRWACALREDLLAYAGVWEKASLPADRTALKDAAEKAQDDLMNLGALVASEPLVAALSHAYEAKQLAADAQAFLQQPWVRQLIADAQKQGEELIRQGKWAEAMNLYGQGGLTDLDSDNLAYEETLSRIQQHVRVINLYDGGGQEANWRVEERAPEEVVPGPEGARMAVPSSTRPATTQPSGGEEQEPRWREMIAGIDTRMVRNAISQIDYNYVEAPDYRKLGIAALKAVKVLVETPQAAAAFGSLKDETKRAAFLAGLDAQLDQFAKLSEVDHLHVALALNRVLDLNAETLALPPEVINMEFAEGLTGALDRFTSMIWPYEMEEFEKRTIGTFFGIGIEIRKDPGKPIEVVTPLPDTPAFRARILAGDMILRVDGKDTRNMQLSNAVKLITGERHTTVTLTIQRSGLPKPFDVPVVRDKIDIQTVKGWRRLPDGKWDYFLDGQDGVAYLRITQFTNSTVEELREALRELRKAGAKGLILDLRFNPGGLLNVAVDVADEFLPRGLIVRTKGRNVTEAELSATALGEYQKGKLVVLVNQVSASAAEIVSGALKDWGRAIVVGERTYGKASVQRLIPLRPKRARLKLTTAHYYLPSGTPLHHVNGAKEWGVNPHLVVPVTPRQINRWAEIRRETDLLKEVDKDILSELLTQQLREDLQLQTALLAVRLQLLAEQT